MRRFFSLALLALAPLMAPAVLRAQCDPSRIRAEIDRAKEARDDFVLFADIEPREGVAEICRYISRLATARAMFAASDCGPESRALLAYAARLSTEAEHTRRAYVRRWRKRPGSEPLAGCAP